MLPLLSQPYCLSSMNREKSRVLLRFQSKQIPGDPLRRHSTLIDDFCSRVLGREFDYADDYFHIEGRIDLDDRCHIVLDLNVGEIDQSLSGIPIFHYVVGYENEQL